MKPIRNQVFCVGCNRTKMLFETQAKANNFIKFNSEGIKEENGKAPVRSYYCEFCGGYHVTSNPSLSEGERLDSRDIQRLNQLDHYGSQVEEAKKLQIALAAKIDKIRFLLCCGQISEAQDIIDVCSLEIDEFFENNNGVGDSLLRSTSKLTTYRQRLEKMQSILSLVRKIDDGSYGLSENISGFSSEKKKILYNAVISKDIRDLIKESTFFAKSGNKDAALLNIEKGKELIEAFKGTGKKNLLEYYRKVLLAQGKKIQSGEIFSNSESIPCQKQPSKSKVVKHKYIDKDSYRKNILELLGRLDRIKSSYDNGDYEDCITMVDVGFMIIEELDVDDKNVQLIKRQFENWENTLSSI